MGLHALRARTVIISLLALGALVLAGCGSGNSPGGDVAHLGSATTTTTTAADTGGPLGGDFASNYRQLVRFSECMRAHGEPNFPDPVEKDGGVTLSGNGIDRNSPQYRSAVRACASYAPPGIGTSASPARLQEQLDVFATCIRSHGVPNFPNPKVSSTAGSGGRRKVSVRLGGPGFDRNTPQFARAQQACRSTLTGSF